LWFARSEPYSDFTYALDHLLGVAEQHHGVVAEEQLVLDPRVARAHAALDEEHRARLLDVEDRHAEDRRLAGSVLAAGLVTSLAPITNATSAGRELAVDVLQLEHLVIGDVGFGQEDVHVAGHAAGDGVDGVLHLHALFLQLVGHLAQRVLSLGHGHAVAGDDDDLRRVLHDEGRVVGEPCLTGRVSAVPPGPAAAIGGAEAAEDHRDEDCGSSPCT
jgi:hypothetical protein